MLDYQNQSTNRIARRLLMLDSFVKSGNHYGIKRVIEETEYDARANASKGSSKDAR